MVKTMTEDYGNPAAMHRKGVEAEQYINEARQSIAAKLLKVQEKEILFTSGGTESNNTGTDLDAHGQTREAESTSSAP
ncbi:MAG: aminotransferase class V-fold PLP-dependent enzyme [Clostridium sp.]